jgi:hypothetical protein
MGVRLAPTMTMGSGLVMVLLSSSKACSRVARIYL